MDENKSGLLYFIVGVFLALLIWGAQLIGVVVNVFLGGVVLAAAFGFVIYAFWIWERPAKWHVLLRIGTIAIAAILYCSLVGRQMIAEWRKEHPRVVAKASEIVPQSTNNPGPSPSSTPILPIPSVSKGSAKVSKRNKNQAVQKNEGGSSNTNAQIGTAQGPVAIAPNGIANAAPNFGNQTVNNAPPLPRVTWTQEPLRAEYGLANIHPRVAMVSPDEAWQKAQARIAELMHNPGVLVSLSTDGPFTNASFWAECDISCEGVASQTGTVGSISYIGFAKIRENEVGILVTIPGTLLKGQSVEWEIRSQNKDPLTITKVEAVAAK
jgi:hypothetical protein